jgi:ABC-type phosphate transport system substrate-binding protein
MTKIFTFLTILVCSLPCYADVSVITHPDNPNTFETEDIQKLFLGKQRTFANGESALVYALPNSHGATNYFVSSALNKSNTQWRAYWSKRMFTGKGRPPTVRDDNEAMLDMVTKNPNAIGFVDSQYVNSNVKVVMVF